ncbi:MAG: hypothetical protein QOG00_494 [Pyrinomonadaceae bacterium]|nr:hypothetical protein [Pyrinomonadaceae bacterium]
MNKVKKEDGDRDRLVEYLRLTEGVEYKTIDIDVKLPSGKDFDYLLRASTGESTALEITFLTDKDETHPDENEHHDFLGDSERYQKLIQILQSALSNESLLYDICIGVPYYVILTSKELDRLSENKPVLASIKNQLLAVIQNLVPGDSQSVPTGVGSLQVDCISADPGLSFRNIGGHHSAIFDVDYFAAKIKTKIPYKNQQLDYHADRRILLFCNTIFMTYDSLIIKAAIIKAIIDFIQTSPDGVSNIDEIYVDFSLNKIERVYPAVA